MTRPLLPPALRRLRSLALAGILSGSAVALSPAGALAQIPSPEEFFGHRMGADRKLARWDRLVEYYELIGRESDRVRVVEVGPSTLGRPFLVLWTPRRRPSTGSPTTSA